VGLFVFLMERLLHMSRSLVLLSALVLLGTSWTAVGVADEATRKQTIEKGIDFLRVRGQADDGSFSVQSGSAVTGLCVSAILENRPQAINDPVVVDALGFLQTQIREDGGIYSQGSKHRNYETCVAVQAFQAANRDGRYDALLSNAEAFLKGLQWDEGEGIEPSDTAYGGAGYGNHQRPDLSNTAFMIEALHELGNGPEDEAIQKALVFVSRTQNLETSYNDTPFAAKVNDGGFYYTPAAGGQSQAGQTPSGGLRSYGSMTYAGLKSMIYAGVDKDDPRVKAALAFLRKNYALDRNPGMGKAGLYYYYHTLAKAIDAAEIETLEAADGVAHDWKAELIATLAADQQADGSWINEANARWMEGDAQLVTAYALLALAHCE
jgi:squalene-hopene/tetraprenyl-beta-curcumene cyclase